MAPRGAKKRSQIGEAILPPLRQSSAKAWAGVADSEFDLRVLCKGGELLLCHRAILASASSFLKVLLQGHQVQIKEGIWVEIASSVDLLILDEVTACHLKGLLCLIYNGFADVTLDSAAELKDVWEHLGVDVVKFEQPQIDVVDNDTQTIQNLKRVASSHFFKPSPELGSVNVKSEANEDSVPEPATKVQPPVKKMRGPASKTIKQAAVKRKDAEVVDNQPKQDLIIAAAAGAKKTRAEGGGSNYFVEKVHVCKICHGKDQNGKVDKEGLNLSFSPKELKKLVGHYGKHVYDEGRVFKHVPLGPDNVDRGQGVDEYGRTYRYKCNYKTCWKSLKGECGYKEFALHVISDHGGLEMVLEEDERPELQTVLGQIRQVKEEKRAADQPLCCVVVGCEDADREHIKDGDYRTLRNHYAVAHWRRWFERPQGPGQPPRTQKLSKTGAFCQVCNLKMFGDDAKMIEHYAVAHGRLQEAILEEQDSKQPVVGAEDAKAVLGQLFPDLLTSDKVAEGTLDLEKMVEVVVPSLKEELREDMFVDPDDI